MVAAHHLEDAVAETALAVHRVVAAVEMQRRRSVAPRAAVGVQLHRHLRRRAAQVQRAHRLCAAVANRTRDLTSKSIRYSRVFPLAISFGRCKVFSTSLGVQLNPLHFISLDVLLDNNR